MPESALCRKRTPVRVNLGIRTLPMETRILSATACTLGYPLTPGHGCPYTRIKEEVPEFPEPPLSFQPGLIAGRGWL